MQKKNVLFVCLGNICRSPMAEAVFLDILKRESVASDFEVDSAGMGGYHIGELADSRMRAHAAKRNYQLLHRARKVSKEDFENFDYIIGMDEQNIRALRQLAENKESIGKIYKMTDFCMRMIDHEVPDPYYGGDSGFEYVIDLLEDSCEGLYKFLKEE